MIFRVFALGYLLAFGLGMQRASAQQIYAAAVAGEPYGIATIEIPVDQAVAGRNLPPVEASETNGRILYPMSDDVRVKVQPETQEAAPQRRGRLLDRVRNLIQEITSEEESLERTVAQRVSFLFVGNEPLRVRLGSPNEPLGTYELVPKDDPEIHRELIAQWWESYTEAARRQIASADYPSWVENYLVAMLAARNDLPLPSWYLEADREEDELLDTLKLIGGTEAVSTAAFRRAAIGGAMPALDAEFEAPDRSPQLSGAATIEPATLPVPEPPDWAPLYQTDDLDGVTVEPLATKVPPEFFYVRYGSFDNFLWFRDLSDEYGGDISRMITLRGFENESAAALERQLSIKTTELSRVLGPTVIADQALIGRDLFLGDGASMGVLMKANNAFVLRTSLMNDRNQAAQLDPAITLKDITILGRTVNAMTTVDNRIRSFMAVDGQYIFICNSRALIKRFLQVSDGEPSLADTAAFRLARQLMPVERDDTIFAYFSPQMLRGLMSPQYLIELRRRLHAKADVALVHLARLAAAQESGGSDAATGIDPLTDAGFLPPGFGTRPDGSGVVTAGEEVIDTLRGARGFFLPIADVEIDAVTAEESEWYASIAQQYSMQFDTIDPIMMGLQRESLPDQPSMERVTVHAEIAPWDPGKYGRIAQQLGQPTRVAMKFAEDDIIAIQAHVASPQLGPPTHLFAAIKDTRPPEPEDFEGLLGIYSSLRQLPAYLGAWPQPGALDRLPLGLGVGQPVGPPGMTRLLGGLYRYTDGQFSVLSFQPDVLRATLPQLAAVDAAEPAQVRLRVGNLQGSQIEGWVNAQLYDRALEGSLAGANFLSLLNRQLRVAPSEAMDAAEQILGSRLQCPLGGEYRFAEATNRWISTAWDAASPPPVAPPQYEAPLMSWFRGATASLTQYDDRVVVDAIVDMQRKSP